VSAGALLLLALAGSAWQRPVEVAAPGPQALTLDAHVYGHARADLGDLRLRDAAGREVPYRLQAMDGAHEPRLARPRLRDRTFHVERGASVVVDFGAPLLKDELLLTLPGDDFRREVRVEGSETAGDWATLVEKVPVFAVPAPHATRYEAVPLPDNGFRFLRVTVSPGAGEERPFAITDVEARRRPPPVEERAQPLGFVTEPEAEPGETRLRLDLGARQQPFTGLELEVADARFFREVRVEAWNEAESGRQGRWHSLGSGCLFRGGPGSRLGERLRLDVAGRAGALRLRIRNGDDRPLDVRRVTLRVPVERVFFEAAAGASYRLRYGDPELTPPRYDLNRTAPAGAPFWEGAREAVLGPAEPAGPARLPPWSERHPGLVQAALVAAVALLGALTWSVWRRSAGAA